MVYEQISSWLYNTSFSDFLSEMQSKVIGQDNLTIFCANVYNYLQNIENRIAVNNNSIIAAPSGSGKTQTYRALKEYFSTKIPELPIYIFDLANLTPSGYKGSESSDIVLPLFATNMIKPVGIVFLDEFDKKLIPSITSAGSDTNFEAQNCILTLVEGSFVYNKKYNRQISTDNIMFVGLGSFDYFREKKENEKDIIGFNNVLSEDKNHFINITRENMVECGGTNELLGRFPIIINYDKQTIGNHHVSNFIKALDFLGLDFDVVEVTDDLNYPTIIIQDDNMDNIKAFSMKANQLALEEAFN